MDIKTILKKQEKYMWGQMNFYERPISIARGEGLYVWDTEGNKYLDFFGGILTVSVGHCNPKVTSKISEQIIKLQHTSTLYPNEKIVRLAEKLAEITPGELKKTYFTKEYWFIILCLLVIDNATSFFV